MSSGGIVDALTEAWNSGDPERIADHYAPDYVGIDVAQSTPQLGPEAVRRSVARYREAFPDLRLTTSATVTQDDRIALFWVARGTHRGPLLNIPPTGRAVEVRGVSLLSVSGGKVTEALYVWDLAGLLRDVGLLPDLSVESPVLG
ncbi:MAG TPA: ester cyclase [Thermomicrobiaceae bacterium]|nr:ester cyclase [Thermomicrobiaceae bacterium]